MYTQYRLRRQLIQLTHQSLALRAGVSLASVTRELGVEPARPMSLMMAMRLGEALSFDAVHVALTHARQVAHQVMNARDSTEATREIFRRVHARLDAALYLQRPFPRHGAGQRLALLLERCRRNISLEQLAQHTCDRAFSSPSQLNRYERGHINIARIHERRKRTSQVLDRMVPKGSRRRAEVRARIVAEDRAARWSEEDSGLEDAFIDSLADGLSELAPEYGPVTRKSLDRLAASFRHVHHINDTLQWRPHTEVIPSGNRFLCPDASGYELSIGTSPTLYDSMEVKLIRAVQPELGSHGPPGSSASGRSVPIRMLGSLSRGIQLGVVISGEADFVLSEVPFSRETMTRIPEYRLGREGVFHKRYCKVGDIAVLPGSGYRRISFHAPSCMVAVISIRSNLIPIEAN